METRSKIIGMGSYLPPKIIENKDLESLLDTSDEWIYRRSGIRKRHWVEDAKVSTSDLAFEASQKALLDAEINPSAIDMIILTTVTPDHEFPGTACFLQGKLKIPEIPTLDVRQQCCGFPYAMSIADQYIRTKKYKKILIVSAELHSKCMDLSPRGRDVSFLFGDGAAAVVLSATEIKDSRTESHLIDTGIFSDGQYAQTLWCPAPGTGLETKERLAQGMMEEGLQYPHMKGKQLFGMAVKTMAQTLKNSLEKNSYSLKDLDLSFFHQANKRIVDAILDVLKLSENKTHCTIEKFGNTTSASIPLGLCDARDKSLLPSGSLSSMVSFGSGLMWGYCLYRW